MQPSHLIRDSDSKGTTETQLWPQKHPHMMLSSKVEVQESNEILVESRFFHWQLIDLHWLPLLTSDDLS